MYGASDFTEIEKWIHLANSYVLGEELIDRRYQNAVLDTILSYCVKRDTFSSNAVVRIIYRGTPLSSQARRVLVDFWAWEATLVLERTWKTDRSYVLGVRRGFDLRIDIAKITTIKRYTKALDESARIIPHYQQQRGWGAEYHDNGRLST
jgi:hypothetical protein